MLFHRGRAPFWRFLMHDLVAYQKKKKRKPCWYLSLQVCPRQLQLFLKSPPVFDSGVLHHITSDPTFIGSKALPSLFDLCYGCHPCFHVIGRGRINYLLLTCLFLILLYSSTLFELDLYQSTIYFGYSAPFFSFGCCTGSSIQAGNWDRQ